MNYHDNSQDFSDLYKLSDIVCNLDESTDNRTETLLSLPINIRGMTKQTNNGTFTRSAYIQTKDNNYPITSKTPGIFDCGENLDGIINASKAVKLDVSTSVPQNIKYVSVRARLDWNVPMSIYSKYPIRTNTNEEQLQSGNLLSLSKSNMFVSNNDAVRVSPIKIDNKLVFIFYIVKRSPKRSPRYCYLYIDIEINDIVVNIAKYFVIGHNHKYSSGKKVTKFVNSASFEIKNSMINIQLEP